MQMNLHQCPQNKNDWDTASQRLQCVDPNIYHCLRTENGGETEQCLGKVWIQEGMCPEYNSKVGKIDVFSCKDFPGCPTEIYWSNEVYRFSICSEKSIQVSTTSASFPTTREDGQFPINVVLIALGAFIILITLLFGVIYFIRKRRIRRNEQQSIDQLEQAPAEMRSEVQTTTEVPLLESYSIRSEDRITTEPRLLASCANLDSHLDDAENLGRTGILIFVSDNSAGIGQRMNTIEKDGRFGRAEYSATPSTWEAEKDVYLYFFRQPIIDRSSLSDISQKDMDKMYLKTKEFPKHYFVLYFNPYDWEEYKSELFQYEFFKKAMIIKL